MRERIELQRRSDAPAVAGGTIQNYATLATVRARVEMVSGGLYFASLQTERTVTHVVTIRRRVDAIGVEYLLWRGRQLRVERLRDLDTMRRFQEFLCEEISNAEAEWEFWAAVGAGIITDLGDLSDPIEAAYDMGDLSGGASAALDMGELS